VVSTCGDTRSTGARSSNGALHLGAGGDDPPFGDQPRPRILGQIHRVLQLRTGVHPPLGGPGARNKLSDNGLRQPWDLRDILDGEQLLLAAPVRD
jgi:hypothetical protein